MLPTVKCPHCGREVELSEAITHEWEEATLSKEREKHQRELAEASRLALLKAQKDLRVQFDLELKNSKAAAEEEHQANQKLRDQLLEMNKNIREMQRKGEEQSLENAKKLAEEETKIRDEAKKKAEEEQHLKLLEKDKQLQDAEKMIMELRQKVQQGSQQNQGEVLELELEQLLKNEFANDKVSPVGKGVRGADIVQEVWDKTGNRCGVILWESKNAKWNGEWIEKLKEDQRQMKAELAVIITENLPPDIKLAAYRDGVWICQRTFALGIASALRFNLIQAQYLRRSAEGKQNKMEDLYRYVTGTEFHQRIEAVVSAFIQMQKELDQEKRWFETKWARQEKYLTGAIKHTHGLYGDFQGVVEGGLPELKSPQSAENPDVSQPLLPQK